MRFIEPDDAAFVVSLRTDDKLSRFLSPVSPDLIEQRQWIESYKTREAAGKEYYFVIELKDGTPVGAVRIYDLQKESFSWGSWVIKPKQTPNVAIESAVRIYDFAFEKLGYRKAHFEVLKGNASVIKFHFSFGAVQVDEGEVAYYFTNTYENVQKAKAKYCKFWG